MVRAASGGGTGKSPDFLSFASVESMGDATRKNEDEGSRPSDDAALSARLKRLGARPDPNGTCCPAGGFLGNGARLPALDRVGRGRVRGSGARLVPRPRARDLALGPDRVRAARLRGGRAQRDPRRGRRDRLAGRAAEELNL